MKALTRCLFGGCSSTAESSGLRLTELLRLHGVAGGLGKTAAED
jgi:hypothetical protein